MNIVLKNNKVTFKSLSVGDVFMYSNFVYLKINDNVDHDNVFNLDTEQMTTVYKDTLVKPMNVELVEL